MHFLITLALSILLVCLSRVALKGFHYEVKLFKVNRRTYGALYAHAMPCLMACIMAISLVSALGLLFVWASDALR